jgi:16S rRNA (adenine1518-N6/adenine1519-N6)-dimethyltransferase
MLLLGWLHNLDIIESMTLMFQKEVALRIIAQKQTKDYGRLSILCQFLCHCQKVMDLPPQAFTPPPKISSAVVRLTPKLLTDDEKRLLPILEKITAAAFNQRRKMIKSSLKDFFSEEELIQLVLLSTKRAEELSVEEFVKLAHYYCQKTLD